MTAPTPHPDDDPHDDHLTHIDHAGAAMKKEDHSAPFEKDIPEKLPQLEVPDLAPDATGLSPEALSQVPTLTESADADAHAEPTPEPSAPQAPDPQDNETQAESWLKQCEMRMNVLMDDIHQLHERLDELEKYKIKV